MQQRGKIAPHFTLQISLSANSFSCGALFDYTARLIILFNDCQLCEIVFFAGVTEERSKDEDNFVMMARRLPLRERVFFLIFMAANFTPLLLFWSNASFTATDWVNCTRYSSLPATNTLSAICKFPLENDIS